MLEDIMKYTATKDFAYMHDLMIERRKKRIKNQLKNLSFFLSTLIAFILIFINLYLLFI